MNQRPQYSLDHIRGNGGTPLITSFIGSCENVIHKLVLGITNQLFLVASFWILTTSRYDFPTSAREKNPLKKSATPILLKAAGLSGVTRLAAGPISPSKLGL